MTSSQNPAPPAASFTPSSCGILCSWSLSLWYHVFIGHTKTGAYLPLSGKKNVYSWLLVHWDPITSPQIHQQTETAVEAEVLGPSTILNSSPDFSWSCGSTLKHYARVSWCGSSYTIRETQDHFIWYENKHLLWVMNLCEHASVEKKKKHTKSVIPWPHLLYQSNFLIHFA